MRKLSEILNEIYKDLETIEKKLRAQVMASFDPVLAEEMIAVYQYLTAGRPIDRINVTRANNLYKMARNAGLTNRRGQLFSFDEIRRLSNAEALVIDLSASQRTQARKAYDILQAHLKDVALKTWDEVNRYMDLSLDISGETIEALAIDPEFPILETLMANHAKTARTTARRIMQAQARGLETLDIVNLATDDMTKKTREAFDATMFYEDTRIVTDTVFALYDTAEPGAKFCTVCVHDGKTCETCLSFEAEQAEHPVPITERLTGVNAPPFHPYCRCRVEIVR